NPPYGERIGDQQTLKDLYTLLGRKLREELAGWKAAIFTGNPPLARDIGIHAKRSHTLFNGAIECRLLRFDVESARFDAPELRPSTEQKLAGLRDTRRTAAMVSRNQGSPSSLPIEKPTTSNQSRLDQAVASRRRPVSGMFL
ncbi:MAG: hypothetical protein EAZ36_03735, partial [Verrucomicrobia bacterium]